MSDENKEKEHVWTAADITGQVLQFKLDSDTEFVKKSYHDSMVRLHDTIVTRLQRAQKAYCDSLENRLETAILAIDAMRRVEQVKMMMPEITIIAEQAMKQIATAQTAGDK